MNEHDRLVDRAARDAHTVLFIGGLDAGKSTLARADAAYRPARSGRTVAYLDADVGAEDRRSARAPWAMKHIREPDDLTLERLADADALGVRGLARRRRTTCCRWWAALARLHDRAHRRGRRPRRGRHERHGRAASAASS